MKIRDFSDFSCFFIESKHPGGLVDVDREVADAARRAARLQRPLLADGAPVDLLELRPHFRRDLSTGLWKLPK